jgi:GPH family glycoside/pentoside/hexuronide:cation symporter
MAQERGKAFNYAIGFFGLSIPINMLKTYAAIFYVDTLGLPMTQFALLLFLYTFLDAIDNPVYGFLSDRTRSRWGRRKPWMTIATPLLVLGLIFFYSPASTLAGNSLFIYCLLLYSFTGTIDSVINANYAALFPEMFKSDADRAKTNAMRQAFQLVAMIISISLTPIVTKAIGYQMTAIVYGVLGGVTILYMALTSKERYVQSEEDKPKLWSSIWQLVTNKKFWISGLANAFYSAGMAMVLAAMPFFAKYTLGISSLQTTILFASVLLIAIGAVAVWAWLVKKFTVMPVWRASLLALALTFIPLYFARNFVTAIVGSALVGFGFAGVITTMDLIGAKVMDEDSQKYKVHREGIIANALGFMNRLSGLFTSAGFLLVSILFKFESGTNPGPQPDGAARFLLCVFPPILMLISFGFSWLIKFEPKPETVGEPVAD